MSRFVTPTALARHDAETPLTIALPIAFIDCADEVTSSDVDLMVALDRAVSGTNITRDHRSTVLARFPFANRRDR